MCSTCLSGPGHSRALPSFTGSPHCKPSAGCRAPASKNPKTWYWGGENQERSLNAGEISAGRSQEHVLELGAGRGRKRSSGIYPAASPQQAAARVLCLAQMLLHLFCLSFPPRQNSSGDVEGKLASCGVWIRARHCLGEAPGGAAPSGRSLMLNSGEEKAQLVPLLVPKFHICVHPEW